MRSRGSLRCPNRFVTKHNITIKDHRKSCKKLRNKMDKVNLDRLLEEQDKGLDNCFQKIEKWEKFKKDYEVLQTRLNTLPDKISYDVMVPFGSMAMMPGKLVHTNEIFVLLGEDYFVERSAKQAAEIAGRRMKQCETMLSDLLKEKEQLQNWRKYTGEIQGDDLVEIIEEYDPMKEESWKEKHRKSVQAYHKKLANKMKVAEKQISNNDESIPMEENFLTVSEIQKRLSYLETVEEKNDELASEEEECNESLESSESINSEDEDGLVRKGIKWKDQLYTKKNTITFTHTAVVTSSEESSQEEDETDEDQLSRKLVPVIQSPSDIYKEFISNTKSKEPKSILKTKSSNLAVDKEKVLFLGNESTPIVNDANIYPLPKCQILPTVTKKTGYQSFGSTENQKPAVSDIVHEKNPEPKTSHPSSQSTRRVSKFKAQKMSVKM